MDIDELANILQNGKIISSVDYGFQEQEESTVEVKFVGSTKEDGSDYSFDYEYDPPLDGYMKLGTIAKDHPEFSGWIITFSGEKKGLLEMDDTKINDYNMYLVAVVALPDKDKDGRPTVKGVECLYEKTCDDAIMRITRSDKYKDVPTDLLKVVFIVR